MTVELCPMSDLEPSACAHCTGARLDLNDKPERLSADVMAAHPGFCAHCDKPYAAGTDIAAADVNGRRGWCIATHTVRRL